MRVSKAQMKRRNANVWASPFNAIFVVALGLEGSLDDAKDRAIRLAHTFLITECGLNPFEAYAYCCARVEIRLGGPASPVALAVVPDVNLCPASAA